MRVTIIFLWLAIPFFLQSQSADFNWLVGQWKVDSATSQKYEEWQKDGNRLQGQGYSIKEGQKYIFETLFLENFDGQWAYIAIPSKQNITLFALVDYSDNRFVFENKRHDFPQRIIYSYDGNKTMQVFIEADGSDHNFNLTFIKVE